MDIKGMHYDIDFKLNKIDSSQYKNLKVPEKDWVLNEACDIFIKSIAEPRTVPYLGFETSQRTIDDIRTLVLEDVSVKPQKVGNVTFISLPTNYMFFISATAIISKNNCTDREARVIIRQHDDRFEESPFDKSSFEWREVNATFFHDGLKLYTDGSFNIKEIKITYIRKHAYMHNAQDFLPFQKYALPSGKILTGFQNCELPPHTHREIVDIAVLILSNNLDSPNYQLKQAKVNLNQN